MKAVASHLRSKVPCKTAVIKGQKVDYFVSELEGSTVYMHELHCSVLHSSYVSALQVAKFVSRSIP